MPTRRWVSPQANDATDFIYDHTDVICRLNAPPAAAAPASSSNCTVASARGQLTSAGAALLRKGVELSVAEFQAALRADPEGSGSLRSFLASEGVRRATRVWDEAFQAQPPRPVIARLARRAGVQLHAAHAWVNYAGRRDFIMEVNRMRRWYRHGRRLTRRRRGILRTREGTSPQVRGRRTVWTSRLQKHYKLLLRPLRLEGLLHWRRCALALHLAGIPVHSGTLPNERLWSQYRSFFPPGQRRIGERLFALLSDMAFLRYNWGHFNRPWQPKWTRRDALLAQRATDMIGLLRAAASENGAAVEEELAAPFKRRRTDSEH